MSDKLKGTECAFPTGQDGDPGLTKREYFAALAMQAVLGANDDGYTYGNPEEEKEYFTHIASQAVLAADALIEELNK